MFGLFGSFDNSLKSKFKKYLKEEGTKKIMCTYDKLPYLDKYLNPQDFRLLVDEYHCLLKAYSYRDKAIDGVLDSFKKYKSFCFMSATPINATFNPACLDGVPVITADWQNVDKVIVSLQKTNKPYVKAANYIKAYKRDGYIEVNGKRSYEAFFFINSVTDIASILERCNLSNDEVRIICADNDRNRSKLEGYEISSSIDANKPFTFITSKGFEGVDYFSDSGLCFVVSSTSNTNTLAAIDTDIPQIAGRIRTKTNPFRNLIVHIFSTQLDNLSLSFEEMEEATNKAIQAAKETTDMFNSSTGLVREHLREKLSDKLNEAYMYYDKETDTYNVNDLLPKLELYNFKVNKIIYSNGLQIAKAYEENDMKHTKVEWEYLDDDKIAKQGKKMKFEEAYKLYSDLRKKVDYSGTTEALEKQYPLLRPAYDKLGDEVVKYLKYVQKKIKDQLICNSDTSTIDNKIYKIIKDDIKLQTFMPSKKLKEILKNAYELTGKVGTAKASDIENWFECKEIRKTIDEKTVRGYEIYRSKLVFK